MRNLFNFIKKHYTLFLFLILEGFAIALIVENTHFQQSMIISWSNRQAGRVYSAFNSITGYFKLAEANRLLSEENAQLRSEIENSYIKYTNKTFLVEDTLYKQQYDYIEATIVSNSCNKRNNFLMLNKGSFHGVEPDMAVISPDGIVGVVVSVSNNFSNVMSVLHSDGRISVKIKKTNAFGTLLWDGGSYRKGSLVDIPSSRVLELNDTVVTSGFSQNFPEGIMVGTISDFVMDQSTSFYNANLLFSTEYNTLDHVYVIKNLYKEEIEKLTESNPKDE